MRKLLCCSVVLLVLAMVGPVAAAEPTYVTPDRLDLTKVLAPPPAPDSEQQKRDLAAVLAVQAARTSAQSERALADATAGTFGFADVLGTNFSAQHVPAVAALLDKVRSDAAAVLAGGRNSWNRPRPFVVSTDVHSLGERPRGGSYPSVSATEAYLTAILLAGMVPEKGAALFARGREFGDERVILGVHFPSDIEAGRFAATALATVLMQDQAFMKGFAAARSELRQALGL